MKKLPEKIVKLLLSNNDDDIYLGMYMALGYANASYLYARMFRNLMNDDWDKYRLRNICSWTDYYKQNKPEYEAARENNKTTEI